MKKLLSFILVLGTFMSLFAFSIYAEAPHGKCGDDLTYSFDPENGELSIGGVGKMYEAERFGDDYTAFPWYQYRDEIKSILFGDSITSISSNAFRDLNNAENELVLPEELVSIGRGAFRNCGNIRSVLIERCVDSVSADAFKDCVALKDVYYQSTETRWNQINNDENLKNGVEVHFRSKYDTGKCGEDAYWQFDNETLEMSILGKGDMQFDYYAASGVPTRFYNYRNIARSVYIGDEIASIGRQTFLKYSKIENVTIPNSVVYIDNGAFGDCADLKSITIGNGLKTVKTSAFSRCDSLKNVYYIGTEEEWNEIAIEDHNDALLNAVMNFKRVRYSDVPSDIWYTSAALFMTDNGYMSGTSETTFSPDMILNRAMFVQIMAKVSGIDLTKYPHTGAFTDVADGVWYTNAVEWAKAEGITGGTSENTFSPDMNVTREQLATFFRAYASKCGYDLTSVDGAVEKYADRKLISVWALDAVKWAVSHDLISGTSETTLSPRIYASRAQAAVIFRKFVETFA